MGTIIVGIIGFLLGAGSVIGIGLGLAQNLADRGRAALDGAREALTGDVLRDALMGLQELLGGALGG
jgi:hypothetical protein